MNSQTPETDALNIAWNAYTDLRLSEKPMSFEELAGKLELERNELRKVCDKLSECAGLIGYPAMNHLPNWKRVRCALAMYENLQHVKNK